MEIRVVAARIVRREMHSICTKIGLIWAAFASVTACYASNDAASEPQQPNVLMILLDDLGHADIGESGRETDVETPNIDSIGANGMRLTHAYAAAPVCSPARAGLITGRYPTRFGHEFNHPLADRAPVGLPVIEKTWPEWFREAGYATGHIGKWHLGNRMVAQFSPNARGFDYSAHFPGQKKLPTPFLTYFENDTRSQANDRYVDEAMARVAAEFIRKQDQSPWFLYVAMLTPHEQLDLPPGVEEEYSHAVDPKRRKFLAAMSLADHAVGMILEAVESTGRGDDTLIIIASDHSAPPGNGSSNAPFQGTKGTLWEGGIRAPIHLQWKSRLPEGSVYDRPVSTLDLLPTTLKAAGVEVNDSLDGVDLTPYLTGDKSDDPHEYLFWRYGRQFAVRHRDWKLVRAGRRNEPVESRPVRLVNLAEDQQETIDVSNVHPHVRQQLEKAYDSWNSEQAPAAWGDE